MSKSSSESKDHAPTSRRLRDARKHGQVAKSVELSGALSLLFTLLCVISMAPWAAKRIADFRLALEHSFEAVDVSQVQAIFLEALLLMAQLSLIPLGVAAGVYLLSTWLQTGSVWSLDLVKPQLERLNPVAGARRLFSIRSLAQLGFMLAKVGVIAAAVLLVLVHVIGDAIRVIYSDAGAALTVANAALMSLLMWCGGLFVLIGLLDLVYQRWQLLRELRMSSSEVKRERRDDQGNAEIKSQRKSFAKDPMPREQLEFIHMASLVLCDTTGRVVVLVYRPKQYPLPLCIVCGAGDFGAEILGIAQGRKVRTVIDSSLVDALYPSARIGLPIPAKHVEAVLSHLPQAA